MESTIDLNQPSLMKLIRSRINKLLRARGLTRYANAKMWRKVSFFIGMWVFVYMVYVTPYFYTLPWYIRVPFEVLAGFVMAGVGMNVLHDAAHGSLSRNQKINKFFARSLNTLAGWEGIWNTQHNVRHHTYTNIDGHDDDINTPVLRLSPHQKWFWIFKYQHFYAWIFYGLMIVWWVTFKEFFQLYKYQKIYGKKPNQWLKLIFAKAVYFTLWIVIPVNFFKMDFYQNLEFLLVMYFVCGQILGHVFQLAHAVPKAEMLGEEVSNQSNSAERQLATSVNFAPNSRILSWYLGGLNRQATHHLLPSYCHVHYPEFDNEIKEILASTEQELKEYKTFWRAIRAHYQWLKMCGEKPLIV